MKDLAIAARELALNHIRHDAEAGLSEHYIRSTWHYAGGPDYQVHLGGRDEKGKTIPPSKVIVEKVNGIECYFIYNLHELYLEIQSKQLTLI